MQTKFHVFTLLWQEKSMVWYVDYQKYYQFNHNDQTFSKEFFFIMNLAVGGNWPGSPDNTTVFPQIMQVDYIRVFQ
ncbi:MAG: family 16 glycosylhydrolase [Bacteroidales bacterium]|nr:family 16 glycosylhydrolase [Bacteroidales bacterium]